MRILKKIFKRIFKIFNRREAKEEAKKLNLFAEGGKFNKSWETVEEWLNSNIDFSKYKNHLKNLESKNNVFVFNEQKEHEKTYDIMQKNELSFWQKTGVKTRGEWEDYSKYDYHIDTMRHVLRQDNHQGTDPISSFKTILDVGCGPFGIGKLFYAKDFKVGVDSLALSFSHLVPVTCDFPKIESHGEQLPFKDNTFEFGISTNAIDHFEQWEKALSELVRCTMHGGYIFIAIDCREETEIDVCHQVVINYNDVLDLLKSLKIEDRYVQIGPNKSCKKRVIYIGKKI